MNKFTIIKIALGVASKYAALAKSDAVLIDQLRKTGCDVSRHVKGYQHHVNRMEHAMHIAKVANLRDPLNHVYSHAEYWVDDVPNMGTSYEVDASTSFELRRDLAESASCIEVS